MGTIDAGAVHAVFCEVENIGRVGGRLSRHRHHDAGAAAGGGGAEHHLGSVLQPLLPGEERRFVRQRERRRLSVDEGERTEHGVQRRQHAALQPAERGQAARHQPALQRADVLLPERDVMREIGERRIIPAGEVAEPLDHRLGAFGHLRAQGQHVVEQRVGRQAGGARLFHRGSLGVASVKSRHARARV